MSVPRHLPIGNVKPYFRGLVPYVTPCYAGFNTGQRARLDSILREHSPAYARHSSHRPFLDWRARPLAPARKGPRVSVKRDSLHPPESSLFQGSAPLPFSKQAARPATGRYRPRAPHGCLARKKTYFSPRDRDIRAEPPLRGGSVPGLAGQATVERTDARLAILAEQMRVYDTSPQEALGG
jgi:hypothetical protein